MIPRWGGLRTVDAGRLGRFRSRVEAESDGVVRVFEFEAPRGTSGGVSLPGICGMLVSGAGRKVKLLNGEASGLAGSKWKLEVDFEN